MSHDEFRERVMDWTRAKLEADPVATASDLYPDACDRFPELEALSVRQYRVRYVVKVNREFSREDLESARDRRDNRSTRPSRDLPDWVHPDGHDTSNDEPTQRELSL